MLDCIDSGLVFRNQVPHLRAVHAWHPSLARLDNGELLAAFDLGQGAESLDYRTYLSRSRDNGQTWSAPVPLFEDSSERRSTHSIRISRTTDGDLVGFGGRFYRDDPTVGLVNHTNLGYVPMDLLFLRSADNGRTWTGTTVQPSLIGPSFETCHSIIALKDGRWLVPTSTWRGWDGDEPNGMQAIALVSHDHGATWPEYLKVLNGTSQGTIYWEQSLTELPDGRLLAVCWAFQELSGESLPTPYTISDDGQTFLEARPTGLHGQTAKLICLKDGRILCVYRRHDRPGLWANLSTIEDQSWINVAELCLWRGATSGMTGTNTPGEELSALKFGYPSLIQLPDGDVFIVFWCSENCINNIRWLRVRIEKRKHQ
jgi:sialidase-1